MAIGASPCEARLRGPGVRVGCAFFLISDFWPQVPDS
jgi:hypothetical protein